MTNNTLPPDVNEQAESVQYETCKYCKLELKKFRNGKYPNGRDWRMVDEQGRHWSGRVCPTCHSKRNNRRQITKRARKKLYV